MKKWILYFFISISIIFIFSCSKSADKEKNNKSKKPIILGKKIINQSKYNKKEDSNILNFGITPWQDKKRMEIGFAPLLEYLYEQTGYKFVLNVAPSYEQLVDDVLNGYIQVAAFSPGAYSEVLINHSNSIKYMATVSKKGKDYYKGYIIVLKKSKFYSINDLKGKSFAFVEKGSSSGYKYPVAYLFKNNITPEKFFNRIFFLGNHTAVTKAIVNKNVDAGATWSGNYEDAVKQYGDVFRIIYQTPPIPFDAYVASSMLPDSIVTKIKNSLIKITDKTCTLKGEKIVGHKYFPYTGFVERNNKFYDVVIETIKILNKYDKK